MTEKAKADIVEISAFTESRELTCQLRWIRKWHEPRILQQAVRVTQYEGGKVRDIWMEWQDVPYDEGA